MTENKFPGKDISEEDLKTKFPLVAKKNKNHKSKFNVSGVEFGGSLIPIFAGFSCIIMSRSNYKLKNQMFYSQDIIINSNIDF